MSEIKKNIELKVAFIADDIKNLNFFGINHNATFGLMYACQKLIKDKKFKKKIKLFFCESKDIKIKNNKVYASLQEVEVQKKLGNHLKILNEIEAPLEKINIIFARKDPPIDENYISLMLKLSFLHNSREKKNLNPLIINNPDGILLNNEKLIVFSFPSLIPPTLVTAKKDEVKSFLKEHKDIVIKPIFNKGGIGVYRLKEKDKNIDKILKKEMQNEKKLIVQKYIPEAKKGDKRIILLNGEVLGGIQRIPKKGEFRAHISRGASYKKLNLSKRDYEICKKLKPYLIKHGLYFVGIDVIGDYLIEVNFTCPSNILEVGECNKKDIAKKILDWALNFFS